MFEKIALPVKGLANLHLKTIVLIYHAILTKGMFKDPVCNMMVEEKKAKHISEVEGKKIYLCSSICKSEFDNNPMKYGY